MSIEPPRSSILRPLAAGLALVAAGLLLGACGGDPPLGPIQASGRVEADEVRVAAKIAGRIEELTAAEGDGVETGQRVARLATPELAAQVRQAEAAVAAARTAVEQAQARADVLQHHTGTARADVERTRALRDAGAATTRQVEAAEDALEEVRGELRVARAQVDQARAALAERRAAVDAVRASLVEGEVASPIDGLVLHRLAEPGEVVQAGQPLLVLIDPADLYLEVYVPEDRIARVRIGDPARVSVDAFPDRTFAGTVTEVADQAEFTPRDVHLPEERTRLVYGVRVGLENPQGFLKPGMTADAEILARPESEAEAATP